MITPEREKEIRESLRYNRHYAVEGNIVIELLAEIDRLRGELEKTKQDMHLVVSDAGKGLLKERDDLKALLEQEKINYDFSIKQYKELEAMCEVLRNENEKLKERIEKLRKAMSHTFKYADPEFGWANLLKEALAEDDEMKKGK